MVVFSLTTTTSIQLLRDVHLTQTIGLQALRRQQPDSTISTPLATSDGDKLIDHINQSVDVDVIDYGRGHQPEVVGRKANVEVDQTELTSRLSE